MRIFAALAVCTLGACKPPPDPDPSPEAAMVAELADGAVLEVFALDPVGPASDPSTPYFRVLDKAGVFNRQDVLAVPFENGRTLVIARERTTLEQVLANAPEPLPSTHTFRYGRTLGVMELHGAAEVVHRVAVTPSTPAIPATQIAGVTVETPGGTTEPGIEVRLTAEGAAALADFTGDRVGQPIALVIGGQLYADPVVAEPLTEGTLYLSVGKGRTAAKVAEALIAKLTPP